MTDTVERKALTREQLLSAYRAMRTIREFEERVHAEFATGEIPGFVHLYAGEEASAVGVCSNLDDRDTIASTHRGHGLVRRSRPRRALAARTAGTSRHRGPSARSRTVGDSPGSKVSSRSPSTAMTPARASTG